MKFLLHFRYSGSILSISKRGGTGSAVPVPERPMPRHVDVFLHIPKTGGTTLSAIFRRNYKPGELLDHESLAYVPVNWEGLSEEQKKNIKGISGHYYYGIHESFADSATYFTILRDPVERLISMYFYLRTYPGYERLRDMSIEDFVRTEDEAQNQQTLMICGRRLGRDLSAAKAHLAAFAVVGVTEMFDDTLSVLRHRFGWADISYTRQNVSTDRPRAGEIDPSALDVVRRYSELDLELYAFARNRLLQDLERIADTGPRQMEQAI